MGDLQERRPVSHRIFQWLLKRAQKRGSFDRIHCFLNTLPSSMKEQIRIVETEEILLELRREIHLTMEVGEIDKGIASVCLYLQYTVRIAIKSAL